MYCASCGKEIPDNSNYCMFCHAPTKLSTDIDLKLDIVEDEELYDVYKENEDTRDRKNNDDNERPKNKKPLIVGTVVAILVLLITGVSIVSFLNSSSHILSKADASFQSEDYEDALFMYKKVISKNPQNEKLAHALIGAGKSLTEMEDYDPAENYLLEALDIDDIPKEYEIEAFESLIELYMICDQQEKILALKDKYSNKDYLMEVYEEKAIDIPVFSPDGDEELTDDIVVLLSSKQNLDIYYTLDGKDPSSGNGKLYQGEIQLSEGTTVIKACCYKEDKFGPVVEQTYTIKYDLPDFATVTPMNGTFYEETRVTVSTTQNNVSIHYTWDGSKPSASSPKYTGPLTIPEGNNVLSVVVINEKGKEGDVLSCNYTYIPQVPPTE